MCDAMQHHVPCTSTHGRRYATSCSLALAHMVVATQLMGWGGVDNVVCACTHGRCYATSCFLALAHMVGATQLLLGWGGVGLGWGGDDNVPCTCTHGRMFLIFNDRVVNTDIRFLVTSLPHRLHGLITDSVSLQI